MMTGWRTSQDVTNQHYPIQYLLSGSSTEKMDINEKLDNSFFVWTGQRRFYPYWSLLPVLEIDLSSVLPYFEIKSETVLRVPEKRDIFTRISEVANKLIEREIFKGLDKKKVENFLRSIERNIPFERLEILSDEELLTRIKKALAIELMCGLLNDLSDEQTIAFESAIERRGLFK